MICPCCDGKLEDCGNYGMQHNCYFCRDGTVPLWWGCGWLMGLWLCNLGGSIMEWFVKREQAKR